MKKALVAGLGGSLVAALGLTMGQPAVATHQSAAVTHAAKAPVSHKKERVTTDELPNPEEDKRRALREEAVKAVLNGEATPVQRGASTVVKLSDKGGQDAQYVELARETTDRIFVILVEFGNTRHPYYPDQDTNADDPGPGAVRRPARQPDPGARPRRRQLNGLAAGLQPGALPETCTSAKARSRVAQDLLRDAVLGPLQRRRRGHRLGQGPVQRGPLRPVRRLPVRRQRLQQHLGPRPGRRQPVGTPTSWPPGRAGRRGHRRPGDLRPVGPLRLRRRRQLQRARRLHRPLPDRARRRRPGRR